MIRWIVLAAMAVVLGIAAAMQVDLAYAALGTVLGLLCAINALIWYRDRLSWPVTQAEFFAHILLDIAGLGLLLYFSGGATNPFISYYLVPLSITAATLPWRYTWTLAAICIAIYSLLLLYYQPVTAFAVHNHGAPRVNLHYVGMWANFALSALLITYFVVPMARALRQREALLNQLREEELRNEQIMAVATLAAGTAHELGTPLATMKILLEELSAEPTGNDALAADLRILSRQVDSCQQTLRRLVETADRNRLGHAVRYPAADYLQNLLAHWQLLHPETILEQHLDASLADCHISADPTLQQALINLLNNAAQASPDGISVNASRDGGHLALAILDSGPGIGGELARQLGKPVIVKSEQGLGIGLLLSRATLARCGGDVTLYNRPEGGTLTAVRLPVDPTR